jgi:hypothetical protein
VTDAARVRLCVCVFVCVCGFVGVPLLHLIHHDDRTYNKTTFPKTKDAGAAEVNISGLEAHVSFEMVTNAEAVMTIDHMKAKIELGQLAVSVEDAGGSSAKKWMYNKLLALFDEKIKEGQPA